MSVRKSLIDTRAHLGGPDPANARIYEFEEFRLDAGHLMLYQNSRTVALKPKVVETLVALVERQGEVVSNDDLMDRIWAGLSVEESNLTQNIYLLRKTLGNCADGRPLIENFSRRGYRFNGDLRSPVETELVVATQTRTRTVVDETFETSQTGWRWLIGALLLAAFAGAIAFAIISNRTNGRPAVGENFAVGPFDHFEIARQSDTGNITSAKVSRDGKYIAYSDNQSSLWLKSVATGSNVRILQRTDFEHLAVIAISPDDNEIYFSRALKDKKAEIARMPLFGGGAQQKVTDDIWSDLSMSPDGRQFAFIRTNIETGRNNLVIAAADGTSERTLATSGEGAWFGLWSQSTTWSPDGSRIACVGGTTVDGKAVWVIRIFNISDGREEATIKSEPNFRWISSVTWLPDGDHILAISGDKASDGQIYNYTISNGGWRRVTNDLSDYVLLSVTSDGKTIVTTQSENPGNLWILPADGDKTQMRQLTYGRNTMTDATGVSWTPDGKIVYATNAGGKWELWKIDADGENLTQLTQNCAGNDTCSEPLASPDGQYIVFQARKDGVVNIWRMNADGSGPIRLTSDGGVYPSLTPDGKRVVYTNQVAGVTTLWSVPIEGGPAEQFNKIASATGASISPDGRQMAFGYYDKTAKQPFQTCIAPVDAPSPGKCFSISRSFARWTADSRTFYYLDHSYTGIWKQPLSGERELFLQFENERTNNFAFSVDGKSLVVARSKQTQDIVAITDTQ